MFVQASIVASLLAAAPGERWAGKLVLSQTRELPLLGAVETRMEHRVLAEVERRGGELILLERSCGTTLRATGGVTVRFDDRHLRALPPVHIVYREAPDGTWRAGPWRASIPPSRRFDGSPGLPVTVDAPMCGGTLRVIDESRSTATARLSPRGLLGELRVESRQVVLSASNPCLSLALRGGPDAWEGTLRYTPLPEGASCDDVP